MTPCTAGYDCSSGYLCAPTRTDADTHGCATQSCTEGYTCPSDALCESGSNTSNKDDHGCIPILCTEGYVCPSYASCDLTSSTRDKHGCTVITCTGFPCSSVNQACQRDTFGRYACGPKPCATDGDCDCGVCVGAAATKGSCAGRLNVCVNSSGGAPGAAGGGLGGGGAVGSGGVSGSGGRGVDSGIDGG
jgi:hypothetical protein